ncbi:MAG: glycosyl hydrolase 53 family protein [Prevotella sp.]|nr:glycosyl hydrolase 53 family protein [Prevotella sp.]MBR6187691.1 glycosyl hydrolase 53 family protein [Prevotella sp.]
MPELKLFFRRFFYMLAFAMMVAGTAEAQNSAIHYVGGDISLLTKYETQKAQYKDLNGKTISALLPYLKEQGWNTIRVRLMVDPSKSDDPKSVIQDLDYVKALGARIKAAGLRFLLDFHYSDTWADPGSQWTPDAWKSLNDTQLQEQIYVYTRDCLQQLVDAGAKPDFIQTGNEISYGMLWGTKAAVGGNQTNRCYTTSPQANWDRFFRLLRRAGEACREVCPQAKIILHSERAPKPGVLTDYFDRMKNANIDYDIIGLSFYPYFHGNMSVLETAIKQLEAKNYGKDIQVVEMGYPSKWAVQGTTYDYTSVYPYSAEGQRAFTADLIAMLKKHPQVNGLSWWYAEANAKGCNGDLNSGWYNAGLFDNETGRALPALYELKSFNDGYEETVKGDVNGDGVVDVADISAIISVMANGSADVSSASADVNEDGTVDVADISAVITIMAS